MKVSEFDGPRIASGAAFLEGFFDKIKDDKRPKLKECFRAISELFRVCGFFVVFPEDRKKAAFEILIKIVNKTFPNEVGKVENNEEIKAKFEPPRKMSSDEEFVVLFDLDFFNEEARLFSSIEKYSGQFPEEAGKKIEQYRENLPLLIDLVTLILSKRNKK